MTLLDKQSGKEFQAEATNDEGAFKLDAAPAGTYTLLAVTPAGAFVAAESLELKPGNNTPLALTLQETATDAELANGLAQEGSDAVRYVVLGLIGVVAVFAVDEVTSSEGSTTIF